MAQTIKLKRSATAGNIPSTSNIALGEVAINTTDGKMFIKRSVGGTESIVQVGDTSAFLPLSGGSLTGGLSGTTGAFTGKLAVKSSSVHNSFDLYNNGTSYFNGSVTVDDALSVTGGSASLSVAGSVTSTGLTVNGANTYNKIVSYFSGSYISGFQFSDLNGSIFYDAGTDDLTVSAGHANSQLILESGGSETVRLDASGSVGIGTSSLNNQSKLTLQLPSGTNGRILTMARSAGAYAYHLGIDASSKFTLYNNDGTSSLMAIDSSGNVGIGCSPAAYTNYNTLAHSGTTGATFEQRVGSTLTGSLTTDSQVTLNAVTAIPIVFKTTNTERLRIDSQGRVGIGISDPSGYGKFAVQGTGNLINANATSGSAGFQLYEGGQGRFAIETLNGSAGAKFLLAGTERMKILSSGHIYFTLNTNAMGTFNDAIGEVGSGTFALQVSNSAGSALKPLGFRAEDIRFATGSSERLRITSSGIGVGTTNPVAQLAVGSAGRRIEIAGSDGVIRGFDRTASWAAIDFEAASYTFDCGGSLKMTLDSSGRVGIGRTPSISNSKLEVGGADNVSLINVEASGVTGGMGIGSSGLQFFHGSSSKMAIASNSYIHMAGASDVRLTLGSQGTAGNNDANWIRGNGTSLSYNAASANHIWETGGSEKMRIDSSGNVLVGKTALEYENTAGHIFRNDGLQVSIRDSGNVADFNRLSSDGEILRLSKDGATVGSIGTAGNQSYIHGAGTDTGLYWGSNNVYPYRSTGLNDATIDLGQTTHRFKDLYLSHCAKVPKIGATDVGLYFNGSYDAVVPYRPDTDASVDNYLDLGMYSHRWDDIFATNSTIQTSDRNEKQDIESLTEAEQRVAVACKGLMRKFRWKSAVAEKGDDARIHFGIIAQDLQAAFAAESLDAGRYAMFTSDTWTENGVEKTRLGIRYAELLAFIISAI